MLLLAYHSLRADLDALSLEAEVLYLANIQLPGYGSGPALDNGFALSLDIVRDSAAFRPREGSWAEAAAFFARGPALSLPEMAARRLGLHPGDTVEIDTLQGRALFRVAFVGGPLPMVTREAGERYFHSYPFLILVRVPPGGGDRSALEGRLQALAREHALALTADPSDEFTSVIDQMFDTILVLFAGLTSIAGLVAGLGMANTLIASVIERRREIGVLRAVGMTRRQVRGLVVWEAGLLGLTGALIGTLTGLALTLTLAFGSLIDAFGRAIGFGVIFEHLFQVPLPWAVVGAALIAGPAMAMLAGLCPAARAAVVDPAEAMRE